MKNEDTPKLMPCVLSNNHNLLTHKTSWLSALERLVSLENDEDQKLYWQHEYNAMLDMYSSLKLEDESEESNNGY